MEESFESKYKNRLYLLVENKRITIEQQDHFLRRSIQVISPTRDFGLKSLGQVLPEIVIGASSRYINKMKVPYQATSYIAANTRRDGKGSYIYKINKIKYNTKVWSKLQRNICCVFVYQFFVSIPFIVAINADIAE